MIKASDLEQSILKYLQSSTGKYVKSYKIEASFLISGKDVREVINTLRRNGEPIASSTKGYFYTEDPQDILNTITHLRSRQQGIESAIEGLNISLASLTHK